MPSITYSSKALLSLIIHSCRFFPFEIIFATVIKINENIKKKEELEKIILCDVQKEIYPELEKTLLDLLHNSGYPDIKFDKKVDFEKLYNDRV